MNKKEQLNLARLGLEGTLNEIKQFIDSNPKATKLVDEDGRNLLHWAVSGGKVDVFQYLLGLNFDLEAVDESEWTYLHIAVSSGNLEIVKELLQKAPQLADFSNEKGFYAISKNHEEIVNLLVLDYNAKVNIVDNYGQTPLHRACSKAPLRVVTFLVKEGKAQLNVPDRVLKNTPLHIACEEGFGDIAEFLINHGADATKLNSEEKTPLDLADKSLKQYLKGLFDFNI